MVHRAQAGHPGGSLSEIDLMAALYSISLRVRPDDPDWNDRDRFILSKGHASPGMYALLAEKGFITHDDLNSYRVLGGICQGHVDMKWCPGVDFSAGSLGMGLSFGMGWTWNMWPWSFSKEDNAWLYYNISGGIWMVWRQKNNSWYSWDNQSKFWKLL